MNDPALPARRRLSPRAAIGAGMVVCALLVAAYWTLLRTDYAVLSSGLRPAEAAAIVADLDAKGVPHRLRDDGTTVLVPAGQVDDLRLAIGGSDLPLRGAVGFELFNKSDMGLTDFAQKINYQRALQGELARTIMMIDGIESARVHLALPERSLFRQGDARAKAAVELILVPGRPLAPARVEGIRQLVAAAVPELPAGQVVILDGDGQLAAGGATDTAAIRSTAADERVAAQDYYAARVRGALLQQLPGLDIAVRALALPRDGTTSDDTKRDFALRLTIVTATTLIAEDQRIAQDAAGNAASLDEAAGDTIQFETGPTTTMSAPVTRTATAVPAPLPTTRVVEVAASAAERPQVGRTILLVIGAALVGAIALVLGRRRGALPGAEQDFAARFKTRFEAGRASDARG